MAYSYEQILAVDPSNPANVARAASITIFAPGDAAKTPLTLTDTNGSPLPNPLTVNANGFGPAFMHDTLDRVAWEGGGFTGFLTSYEGMKEEAVDARTAAEQAAASAAEGAKTELEARIAAGEFKGDKGADGSNVLPTDTAIAAAINGTGATKTALNATYATAAAVTTATRLRPEADLYEPTRGSLRKWRALRGAVLAGERQGRISCLGDSITFGAAETGNSNPKYNTSWPGRLRARLNTAYGKGGTGLVIANPDIIATPTLDNRFTLTGGVTVGATGAFRDGAMVLAVGSSVEFTAECDGFTVYTLSGSSGHVSIKIDGVQTGLIRNTSSTSGATIPATYTGKNVVAPVAAGTLGTHTIKIEPTTATVTLIGVEATIAGAGRWSVSTTAISGKSLSAGGFIATNNDETNAQHGRPILIDLPRADMHVLALGINDVQTGIATADIKTGMTTAVQRARMSGTNTQGVPYANGDALVVITPGFQSGAQNYTDYKDAMYQVADEQNVALLDLSNRWGPWADANALGMFADTIHPTDRGADDIAAAVHWALFNR